MIYFVYSTSILSLAGGVDHPTHHYLRFFNFKTRIQYLNPTFGFQKPNLGFTNLIYKTALLRVLKKIIWVSKTEFGFSKTKFGFSNYHLKTKLFVRKPNLKIKISIWKPYFENRIRILKYTFGLCLKIRIRFMKTKFVLFQKTVFVF